MKDDTSNSKDLRLTENFSSSAKKTVTLDIERYQSYLDGLDVSDERKEEFLRAMFSIVITFVGLGFGVHPLQQVGEQEPCGKEAGGADQRPKDVVDRVRSKAIPKHEIKNRTGPEGRLEV